jgi:hypothetical protein
MPSLHLAGLLPPVGEKPVISLVTLGRALRQLPKEVWQLTNELPNAFNASSLIFPLKGSDLARALERTKELFRIDRENGLVIFNPHRFEEILRQVGDDERLSIALRELFRPILPTVSEASEKYQVRFNWLLTKVASLPPPAPTMTETVRQRLEGVFQRIAENAEYRLNYELRGLPRRRIEQVAEQLKASPITINIKLHRGQFEGLSVAEGLLREGRYLNTFEIQERYGIRRGTTFESDLRVQQNLFDIPLNAPSSERPVYGAVNVMRFVEGAASDYGPDYLELREEVKKRTTLFYTNTAIATTEHERKSLASFDHPINALHWSLVQYGQLSHRYIEAQIHGGVSLKDVKRLVINEVTLRYNANPQTLQAILQLAAVLESLGAEVMVLKFEGRLVQMGHDEIQAVLRRIR